MNSRVALKKNVSILLLALILVFVFCMPVFADNTKLSDKKMDIETKRGQVKKQIKKIKLLEKIEINKLIKNQQKLEYAQHSLKKNVRQRDDASYEVKSLEKKLDVLLVEHRKHQAYTSK